MLENIYKQFFNVRREEWPKAIGLSLYFFLVIAIFWILKPVKRGLILNYFGEDPLQFMGYVLSGAQAEQLGKVLNTIVAYVVVVVFTILVRRVARHQLVLIACGTFAGLFVLFSAFVGDPNQITVWTFYVLGDIFNTVMVATFWIFANDLHDGSEAKRLYGIVGLGGVVGGFVGATVVNVLVEDLGRPPMLFISTAMIAVIAVLAVWIDRRERKGEPTVACCPDREEDGQPTHAALDGAKIVFQSKYLICIAGLIGVYEIVSNVVDFQLAATVEQQVQGQLDKDAFFGLIGQLTSIGSIVVQLIVTTYVLRRWGVGIALLFLPISILMGSAGFLILPTLVLAGFMSVSDNALNYSINQSAKEALYTTTSQSAKYKAKAFIDMFVQRLGKMVAVGINLGLTALVIAQVRWLSFITMALIAGWIWMVRYLGHAFEGRLKQAAEATAVGG